MIWRRITTGKGRGLRSTDLGLIASDIASDIALLLPPHRIATSQPMTRPRPTS